MVALPFLVVEPHRPRAARGDHAGRPPERDRDIEHIQKMIAACAAAEIPAFKYNMSLLGVLRTEPTAGRGGSRYSTWRLAEANNADRLTRAGRVSADVAWERITYFLDRVIPGLQRVQDPRRLPSARSGSSAGRVPGNRPRAGHGGGTQEVCRDSGRAPTTA